jgi:hypothetical protein
MNRKPVCGDCTCQYTFFLSQGTFRPSDLTLSKSMLIVVSIDQLSTDYHVYEK